MYSPWTRDEKRHMVDTYRRMHLARCPNDRAPLTVTVADTGQTPDEGEHDQALLIQCPTCRRMFFSSDVEPGQGPSVP